MSEVSNKPRILNLDEFAPPDTKFIYQALEYEVQLLSTEAYLRFLQGREKAESASTDEAQALVGIEMLGMVVPTFPKEKAMTMPFPQLIKLLDWIQGLMEGDTKNLNRAVEQTAR
ncbi:MAG: hypothetical protein H8D26_02010 [Methanomicrobia archaeon]|nr:hypothetical protein [Methanomicrobia archaeon]